MNFDKQYLTYDEYTDLGGHLEEEPFNLFELEAKTNIDRLTQARLQKQKQIPNEVKICEYRLIEAMAYDGGYKDSNTQEKKAYISKTIYSFLSNVIVNDVPLTYRGID